MRKIYLLPVLLFLFISPSIFSQLRYDDGPIIVGNNFVTVGTWGRNNITFSFQNGTNDIAGSDEHNAVRQAFQLWADYANLNFTEVTSNADIAISWASWDHGDGNAFDGTNGVLAHAFLPPPNGGSFAGDMHFDDDETWTMAEQAWWAQPIDLVTVAAHEIGHALGLGHSNVTCALMNPFYTGSHRYLAPDDIAGIRSIYGNRAMVRSNNASCAGGTHFINNVPTGASVAWQSSNTAIATVTNNNNQGIVSWTGGQVGTVTITATLTLPCGLTITESFNRHYGTPFPVLGFSVYQQLCGTWLEWWLDPVPWTEGATYNWTFYPAGGTTPLTSTQTVAGPAYASLYVEGNPSTAWDIKIEAQNACGSPPVITTTRVNPCGDCCGGGTTSRITTYPNPAKNEVIVSLKEASLNNLTTKQVDIRILDLVSGQVVKKWTMAIGQKTYRLNIANVKKGYYLVQVITGDFKESKLLLIDK